MGFIDDAFAKKAPPLVQRATGRLKDGGLAADYFLKLEGVEGESKASGHKGEIEICAWSLTEIQIGTAAGGGWGAVGKLNFEDMILTSRVSRASPTLLLAVAVGRHFPKAVLTARKPGEGQQDYLTITMTKLVISAYQIQDLGESDPVPLDVFSLNFTTIEFQYKEPKADGSLGPAVTTSFDLSKMNRR